MLHVAAQILITSRKDYYATCLHCYNVEMRKIIFLIIILLIGYLAFNLLKNSAGSRVKNSGEMQNEEKSDEEPENIKTVAISSKSVFVPYWTVADLSSEELGSYDRTIYFGVSASEQGIDRSESGYSGLPEFIQNTDGKNRLLTLRMLDTESNLKILADSKMQEKVINDLISIVDEYGFDGVVLDLELSVLPYADVKENISMFVRVFGQKLRERDLELAMTIYGDTYFRGRPYDIQELNKFVDEFMIMAYDFHKSYGEPGPNFPLDGRKTYGYDFKKMIDDFLVDVESEKLTVVFGMYGYDWTLGKQGKPLKRGETLTLSQIRERFYPGCDLKSCEIKKDQESAETKITYIDDEGYKHVVWFDDEPSVEEKIEYLKSKGIGRVAYWAYGYY